MSKKKTNPNKIPISPGSVDTQQIILDATLAMTMRGWALVFGAMANRWDSTSEDMVHLWDAVNAYSSTVKSYKDVSEELKKVEAISGLSMPYKSISSANIKTQGDLDKYKRKIYDNALYSAFVLIAEPIFKENLMPEEDIARLFQKAYSLDEDLRRNDPDRITIEDLQGVLWDEYGLCLYEDNGHTCLATKAELEALNNRKPTLDDQISSAKTHAAASTHAEQVAKEADLTR